MPLDLSSLPDDPETLRALIGTLAAERDAVTVERNELKVDNDTLKVLVAQYKKLLFGPRSEKLSPDQLSLGFEDLEQSIAEVEARQDAAEDAKPAGQRRRRKPGEARASLPDDLPVVEEVVDLPAEGKVCPCCNGERHVIGDDVSRRLDIVPAQFRIVVTRRPRYGCRSCEEGVAQAPAPARVVEGGLPTEALIAHILVGKYADGLPLYRQAGIFARQGVALDRSVMADWIGRACWWLRPLYEALHRHLVTTSEKLYADETRLPVLDPGRGRVQIGQLWAYGRDDRPWGGQAPPVVVYRYADGRGASHPRTHLTGFAGLLQVDGYGAYKALVKVGRNGAEPMPVTLVFCWSHLRRRFYDYNLNTPSPVAEEALRRIAAIYHVESGIRGRTPAERFAVRQAEMAPLMEDFRAWTEEQLRRLSGKTKLAEALRYAVNHWDGLTVVLSDGLADLDTNMIERNIRPVCLVRKNALFAGSEGGADHWALVSSLIQTAKLNDIDPFEYLKDVLGTLVADFPSKRIHELLPWEWKARRAQAAAA